MSCEMACEMTCEVTREVTRDSHVLNYPGALPRRALGSMG